MPNLRITTGANPSFEVEGAPTLDLPSEVVDLAHQWLEAVSDTAAEAQKAIENATAKLRTQHDAQEAFVAEHTPPPTT